MTNALEMALHGAGTAALSVAAVVDVLADRTVVARAAGAAEDVHADVLVTTDAAPPVMMPGDTVLLWRRPDGGRGVVLGRVGPTIGVTPAVPDTLVIEARQRLTIRVGDGEISIREDGKVLIKGRDLVSHAQRTNRIKGGSVAIN